MDTETERLSESVMGNDVETVSETESVRGRVSVLDWVIVSETVEVSLTVPVHEGVGPVSVKVAVGVGDVTVTVDVKLFVPGGVKD